tara:strand:- start:44 stop:508 length:465 start_codon:yes stop_codon:yes gene_type:complete
MKSTHAQASKLIKQELKEKFPNTKFSVTSEIFAGGNAVRVEWVEGAKEDDVREITNKYEYGRFNGMEDIYEITNRREDIPQVKYITLKREISAKTTAKVIEKINKDFGLDIAFKIEPSSWRKNWDNIIIEDYFIKDMNCYSTHFVYRQLREYNI